MIIDDGPPQPNPKAALFAGLPAQALTKHEAALFRRPQEYFKCRQVVLELWMANPKDCLPFTACLEEADRRSLPEHTMLEAYQFLVRHAYVNVGFLSMDRVGPGLDLVVLTTYKALLESNLEVRTLHTSIDTVAFHLPLQKRSWLCVFSAFFCVLCDFAH